MTRTVTVLTGFAALLIAAALPVTYLLAAQSRLQGALEASARLHAAEMAELVRVNPALWEFESLSVSAPTEGRASVERRRVFNEQGRLVIESVPNQELAWPVLTHREPIFVNGQKSGEVEAARSMRDALLTMLLVASASACLGLAIFAVLRVLPLRLLNRALERASYLAAHDLLTGLPNRGLFTDRLRQALALAGRVPGGGVGGGRPG